METGRILFLSLVILTVTFALFQNCAQNANQSDEASSGSCAFLETEEWSIKLASNNIKAGDTVAFRIEQSNLLSNIEADYGDGSGSEEVTPAKGKTITIAKHQYSTEGQYQATFTLYDLCDGELVVTVDVAVAASSTGQSPTPSVSPSPTATTSPSPAASPSPTCKANGTSCTSGSQCCVGYCTYGKCGVLIPIGR